MALIAEVRTKSGAVAQIFDDFMAAPGSEEEKKRIEAQRRAAWEIIKTYQSMEEKTHGADTH